MFWCRYNITGVIKYFNFNKFIITCKHLPRCVTLMQMLDVYGVRLSCTLHNMLKTHVVLPGEDSSDDVQNNLVQSHLKLENEQKTHLLLKKSVTSKILWELYAALMAFVNPIFNKLEMFLYFYLHNCEVFSKYLKYQLTLITKSQCSVKQSQYKLALPPASSSVCSQEFFIDPDERIAQVYCSALVQLQHLRKQFRSKFFENQRPTNTFVGRLCTNLLLLCGQGSIMHY